MVTRQRVTGLQRWCTLLLMYSTTVASHKQRSTISVFFISTVRVLFITLLFTAAGMGAGLFCGIVGTVIYGIIKGTAVDMTNAYKHVAIPAAILAGSIGLIGAVVLEIRARRQRTSL